MVVVLVLGVVMLVVGGGGDRWWVWPVRCGLYDVGLGKVWYNESPMEILQISRLGVWFLTVTGNDRVLCLLFILTLTLPALTKSLQSPPNSRSSISLRPR